MRSYKALIMKKGLRPLMCLTALMFLMALAGCGRHKTVTCIEDLEGSRIGVQLGTVGDVNASEYEGDKAGTVIERYNKGNDAIQALKQKKIDAVIIDAEPAKAYVQKNADLKILDEEFMLEEYAICIAKGNSELRENINEALKQLKADGTFAMIEANYTGSDEQKGKTPYVPKNIERPNGTLIAATNAAFPPYEYYSEGVMTGFDIDMIQAVCDVLGMTLKMEDMEFDSIITAVQSGKAMVGVAGMSVTPDRLKNIDFTDSYTTSKQVIIVKDPEAKVEHVSFSEKFKDNFIVEGRWQYIVKGLGNTLIITLLAIIIGCVFGFLIAVVRTSHDKNGSLKILNAICKLYLTIIRGTPVMVQLLIIYYVIFASVNTSKILVAVIAFGINSAAYVAEVVRSGIMSVDNGQFEAGRSLGLNYRQTMMLIILPQAIKNILPALGNEFISLLKETSISGYIGLMDLTKGGDIVRSITYEAFLPLIAVALIYLVIVMILSFGVNRLERRLKKNER